MFVKKLLWLAFCVVPSLICQSLPEKSIVIVTCSYNNSSWYRWNLDGIRNQNYTNFKCIYIDDCSTDGTGDLVEAYIDEHDLHDMVILVRNDERKGAMYNQYMAVHNYCQDEDIVIICDGDDRFAYDGVLSFINTLYSTTDTWLSYGQFKEYPSGAIGFCSPMPAHVVASNSFRSHGHIPSHLRTFYAGLFKKIRKEDLMYQEKFLQMTCDMAAMLPMIEMARDNFTFVSTVLLEYNAANDICDHKVNKNLQREMDLLIRSRPCYEKISSPF